VNPGLLRQQLPPLGQPRLQTGNGGALRGRRQQAVGGVAQGRFLTGNIGRNAAGHGLRHHQAALGLFRRRREGRAILGTYFMHAGIGEVGGLHRGQLAGGARLPRPLLVGGGQKIGLVIRLGRNMQGQCHLHHGAGRAAAIDKGNPENDGGVQRQGRGKGQAQSLGVRIHYTCRHGDISRNRLEQVHQMAQDSTARRSARSAAGFAPRHS